MSDGLCIEDLSLHLGGQAVLQNLHFHVPTGESLGVMGPSGCGKTVLLKTIAGIFPHAAGRITLDGRPLDRRTVKIGMLFQRSGLFDSMTVGENIAFRRLSQGLNRRDALDQALENLLLVGLQAEDLSLYPRALSGGMQKRVGIARAMMDAPEILLLDDPTAGLDPMTGNRINRMIMSFAGQNNTTVINVNSTMAGVRYLSTRAIMLHEGRLMACVQTDAMHESHNPHVAQFVNARMEGPIAIEN